MMPRRLKFVIATAGSCVVILVSLVLLDLLTLGRYFGLSYAAFVVLTSYYRPWRWRGVGTKFILIVGSAGLIAIAILTAELLDAAPI